MHTLNNPALRIVRLHGRLVHACESCLSLSLGHGNNMAIRRLIAAGSYGPDEIRAMTDAYDIALIVLRLNDKDDPITELLAKSIAAIVATGERKPGEIATKAIDALGIDRKNV